MTSDSEPGAFDDLLTANERFATTFSLRGAEGVARAGVAMVTCMDARIDPLAMIGLAPGDAKVLRNAGGRVTDQTLVALALATNLLNVRRVLVVQHTRCAMASADEPAMRKRLSDASGVDASWMSIGMTADQAAAVTDDVGKVRAYPLIAPSVAVGGFLYDVDTGRLNPVT